MKPVLALSLCALLFAVACSQSPEKLLTEANKYHNNKKYEEASILYQKILVKDKTNAEAYYRMGLNFLDQGKGREAVAALRRAVDLKPSNTDAVAKLTQLYIYGYASDPVHGKSLIPDINQLDGKLLQQDPNSFEGLRLKGLIAALIEKDLPKAEESFAKANSIKPNSRDLVEPYAEILANDGKRDQAIALLNATLANDKSWDKGYNLLLVLYAQGHQADKVETTLRQHLDADPTSESAIVNYANYKQHNGDYNGAEQLMLRLTKNPKAFPNAQLLLGSFYASANKLEQAKAAFEEGKKDDPKNSLAYDENLIKVQVAYKHLPEALAMAKNLADKNPKDVTATGMYAELLLKTNSRDAAPKVIDELKKIVENNPANTALRLDLAKAYFEAGERDKSLTTLQQVVSDAQKDQDKIRRTQPALVPAEALEAQIYGDSGQVNKALELSEAVLSLDPKLVEPGVLLSTRIVHDRALIVANRAVQAQPDLAALIQQYPSLVEPHLLMADFYLTQKQFDKATQEYEIASKGNPNDRRAVIGLQTVKLLSGHATEAVATIQDLVSKNPTDVLMRMELAKFETRAAAIPPNLNQPAGKQLLQQAEDNFKQIIANNPSVKDDIWMNLAAVQRALGQNDAALASLEQASNVNPKNEVAFLEQALLLDSMNRKKEAIDDYNKVLTIRPDNPLALNNLAMISAETGTNLDQAQTYAERAKKGAPNSPDVDDTLGFVYLQKNLNTQAAEIFRENVQKFPQVPAFRFHLAMALLKQGDKQGAKDQANRALQGANPDMQSKIKAFVGQIG